MSKYAGTLFLTQGQVIGLCICIQQVKRLSCLLQQDIMTMQNLLVSMSNSCLICQKSILGCIKNLLTKVCLLLGEVIVLGRSLAKFDYRINFDASNKSRGGLTRGRGFTKRVWILWIYGYLRMDQVKFVEDSL